MAAPNSIGRPRSPSARSGLTPQIHGGPLRAEAIRHHHGRAGRWQGKWRKDIAEAIAQAKRWQMKEPTADIYVVSDNGMRATLEELRTAPASRA